MPSFLSTTNTIAKPKMDISSHGTHQLALRRMSVNVLLGATNVSTKRSISVRGLFSSGTAATVAFTRPPCWRNREPDSRHLRFSIATVTVCRVSLADGRALWRAALRVRVLNAGVTVDGDSAWVLSARGRLIGVRLADGRRLGSVQHTLAHSFSRPVIVGGTLVAGDQDGFVHGIRLP